jgi:hypothetical protein
LSNCVEKSSLTLYNASKRFMLFIPSNIKRTQTQHVVKNTGVFNNHVPGVVPIDVPGVVRWNHQTYFLIFCLEQTDRHTGAPVEVPPVLKKETSRRRKNGVNRSILSMLVYISPIHVLIFI